MQQSASRDDWCQLARRYIGRGQREALAEARRLASDPSTKSFLRAVAADDLKRALHWQHRIRNASPEAAATSKLLCLHFYMDLSSSWKFAAASEREALWDKGARACREAAQIAVGLGDLDCEGLFLGTLAQGLLGRDAFADAIAPARRAIECFGRLASSDMAEYGPDVASAMTILGTAHQALKDFNAARVEYERALAMYSGEALAGYVDRDARLGHVLQLLGDTLRSLREFEASRNAYEKALVIRQRLAAGNAHRDPYVAMTDNSLGLMHAALHEWDPAWEHFERALSAQRLWAQDEPAVAQFEVFKTLVNMGSTASSFQLWRKQGCDVKTSALHQRDCAWRVYQAALDVLQSAELANWPVFNNPLGSLTNNIGAELHNRGDLQGAARCLEEAVALYRSHVDAFPHYRAEYAACLLNRGAVRVELGLLAAAREDLLESLGIRTALSRWFDVALCHEALARLEAACGSHDLALSQTREAIAFLERGLRARNEFAHRDLMKGPIEDAYLRLIDHYAASGSLSPDQSRLAAVLESCRAAEALVESGTPYPAEGHEESVLGSLASTSRDTVFLWVHVTETQVVMLAAVRGHVHTLTASLELDQTLLELESAVRGATSSEALTRKMLTSGFAGWNLAPWFRGLCRRAFEALPELLKQWLRSPDYPTLCISTCSKSANVPWELLLHSDDENSYLGLSHCIVRVPRLGTAPALWRRRPRGRSAVLVSNPTHVRMPHLEHARRTVLNRPGI